MREKKIEVRFLEDTKDHEMTVIHDDGIIRHIRFRRKNDSAYFFDLTTWNNHLCISGDMGCYVFSRIQDMFNFFIMSENDFNRSRDGGMSINPYYWSEKLQAVNSHGQSSTGIKEFNEDIFREWVKNYFDDTMKHEDDLSDEDKDGVWSEIEEDVLCADSESEAYRLTYEFSNENFDFETTDGICCNQYTHHYIWCLYAIVWGITEYRKSKPEARK